MKYTEKITFLEDLKIILDTVWIVLNVMESVQKHPLRWKCLWDQKHS